MNHSSCVGNKGRTSPSRPARSDVGPHSTAAQGDEVCGVAVPRFCEKWEEHKAPSGLLLETLPLLQIKLSPSVWDVISHTPFETGTVHQSFGPIGQTGQRIHASPPTPDQEQRSEHQMWCPRGMRFLSRGMTRGFT